MAKRLILSVFMLATFVSLSAQTGWEIRLMPQVAFGGRNDVQRPNDLTGTRFSLSSEFERKNEAVFSPRIEIQFNYKRHYITATAALLKDRFEAVASRDLIYDGTLFNTGEHLEAVYKFNTYRLGYRYRLVDRPRLKFELGATILLRDAFISVADASRKSKFDNVGVAPLVSYSLEWMATERLSLLTYGDAFAIKVGRAEDIFAGVKYRFSPLVSGMAGYRILEGGSDSDRVYTMAAFHYLSLGIGFSF